MSKLVLKALLILNLALIFGKSIPQMVIWFKNLPNIWFRSNFDSKTCQTFDSVRWRGSASRGRACWEMWRTLWTKMSRSDNISLTPLAARITQAGMVTARSYTHSVEKWCAFLHKQYPLPNLALQMFNLALQMFNLALQMFSSTLIETCVPHMSMLDVLRYQIGTVFLTLVSHLRMYMSYRFCLLFLSSVALAPHKEFICLN